MKKVINILNTTIALSPAEQIGLYEVAKAYLLPWKEMLGELVEVAKELKVKNTTAFIRDTIIINLVEIKNGSKKLHRKNSTLN